MSGLAQWLGRHGLDKVTDIMVDNDVDLDLLPDLTEQDLKDLGLNVGQRRRLLRAIAEDILPEAEVPSHADASPAIPAESTPGVSDGAERRQLSVLFCDLVGSTELSRQLDPEDLREVMRAYQNAVAGAITRYGGHVAKYLGDGVLGFFGWPVAYEDQTARAVRAGLEMGNAVFTIPVPDGARLSVRVGIASGEVVIGDLVNDTGTEAGAVAGETPNLASRLQTLASPGEVVICESTDRLIGSTFETERKGAHAMKGFDAPIECVLVHRERPVESRFEAMRGGELSELVGRVHEIGLLTERWHQARSGRGAVVLLSGEAGIGKSRLVEALASHVREDGGQVSRLQCSPYFTSSAFHPVIERIRQAAGISEADDPPAQTRKLMGLMSVDEVEAPEAKQIYANLLSIELPADIPQRELVPAELKEMTLSVLSERPVQLANRAPLLLVLEDAHWIDPSTLELMERLVTRVAELPVMITVTHRPEWQSDWSSLFGHVTALTVGKLDRDQISELMENVLGTSPSQTLIEEIVRRTDGVPLFVEEFCEAMSASAEAGEHVAKTIPESLHGLLMARLDQLPESAKSLAMIASVIGREFDRTLLWQVARRPTEDLNRDLEALRRAQVVFASGIAPNIWVFRHALIQDTAYHALLNRNRERHHSAIAETLANSHPDILAREPELIAYHHAAAGQNEAARPLWIRAAERAYNRSATFEAVTHAREAFRVSKGRGLEEVEARILLGRALESAGQITSGNDMLREAIRLARTQDDDDFFAAAAISFANTLYLSLEPHGEALEPLEEALARTDGKEDVLTSQILSQIVRGAVLSGDRARVRKYRQRALDAARRCGDSASLHGIQIAAFIAPVTLREPDEVTNWRTRIDEMLETADQINDDTKARSRSIAHYVSAEMGDRDRMEAMLASIKEVGEARQHMHIAWVARHGDAMLAILDGRFEEAEVLAKEALEIGRQTHGEHVEGVYGIQMFTIRREQGRLAEVAPVIKKMLDEDPSDTSWRPGFALIASDLGYGDAAVRILNELAEADFALELDAKYSTTLSYLAEVATCSEDETICKRLYDLLLPYKGLTITAGVTTVCVGAADRFLGSLSTALGNWEAAEDHYTAALELDARMRAEPWLAHTQHALAEMLEKRGAASDRLRIATLRENVLETCDKFGMVALQQKCRHYIQ